MQASRPYLSLLNYVFLFSLAFILTGCGAGSDSNTGNGGNNPSIEIPSPNEPRVSNSAIFADAGKIIAVRVTESVTLDGSASSTSLSAPLIFDWSFLAIPETSLVELSNETTANPVFIPDVAGTYTVQLIVSAGGLVSQRAIAFIEVTVNGHSTGTRVHTSFPARCADCHDGRFAQGDGPIDPIPPKSGDHIATSNACEACHTTFGFEQIQFVDHLAVFGVCSSCHDGETAIGKSEFHIETSAECDDCHTTSGFLTLNIDGNFDHTGITRGCDTCHNGITAIGKNEGHFVTDAECSACHNTSNFKDAFVDHSTITENCASCHDGTTATGQTIGHPEMSVDCGICHSTSIFSLDGVFNHRVVDASVQPCEDCHTDSNSISARGKAAAVNHPPTTADCGVCHGVGGGNFADGIFDHTGIVNNCNKCHGDAGNGSGLGKSITHIPTSADCSVCHTVGTFTTGFFTHNSEIVDPVSCTSCHDGTFTLGLTENHLPTTEDCRLCHLNTDTFTDATFDHAGVDTRNCSVCHNGDISTGKNTNHLPTIRDCSDCHNSSQFTDFKGASFDHQDTDTICASCHDGIIAIDKTADHIPAQKECSQCHTDTTTGGFAMSIFMDDVHPGLSSGCEGCHTLRFFADTPTALKSTNHIPTSQDCRVCHTNTAFSPNIFDHTGITGNCTSCHDGNFVDPAGALGITPDHLVTTEDCGLCHGIGANFTDGVFDHTGIVDSCSDCHGDNGTGAITKKNAGHVPTTQDCSVCHVVGTFATAVFDHVGIVDNCTACHDGSIAIATVKNISHIPTTEDCSVCHNTTVFAGAKFDHTGILNNCATCHDGNTTIGKDGSHVPTNDDCNVCHQTTGFIPATFDHTGIVDNCQSCHDGTLAQGKGNNHVQTTADCGLCHTPTGFVPATFDHSAISNNTRCDSCHGVTATGTDAKTNPPHIPTSLDCRSCHTTATFAGGTWTHDSSSTGRCDSCHNNTGGGATPKPTRGHISTNLQCDDCHTTNAWAPTSFNHDPSGNYPGDHRKKLACGACHGNVVTTPFAYPFSQYAPFCAACHKNDFEREGDHIGGKNGSVAQNKDCSGGGRGCHRVSDRNFD
ncbi:MAG: hypothetical protein COB30_002180 [Ectothiorhodospiraceae bacterium]|nr:hypothetical protein [Ectothiorhodospiraceae bacterium]